MRATGRRTIFTAVLAISLFASMANSSNATTFDLLPNTTIEIQVTGDLSTPGSITLTESMQPTLSELLASSGATGFTGYIYNTGVYQSGNSNTGFFTPEACTSSDCGLLGGMVECLCGIDLPPGYILGRGSPVTVSVTDNSRYFRFEDYFSTIGLVTNAGVVPFTLKLTVDVSDNLGLALVAISSGDLDPPPLPGDIVTPLPSTLPLFATGLGALGLFARRRKRKQAA